MNGPRKALFGLSLLYSRDFLLDIFGVLWYHSTVKLGCFATAPKEFGASETHPQKTDQVVCENGIASVFFRLFGGLGCVGFA